ncbi:hypothetical protein EON65_02090 [archaeon]|nr:MAG: hypothetical protein EON65_02090 [archaeon]
MALLSENEELVNAVSSFITHDLHMFHCKQLHALLEHNAPKLILRQWLDNMEKYFAGIFSSMNLQDYITWRHPTNNHTAYTLAVTLGRTDVIRLFCEYGMDMERLGSPFLAVFTLNSSLLQFCLVDSSMDLRRESKYLPLGQWGLTLRSNIASTGRFVDILKVLLQQPLGQLYVRDLVGPWVCDLVISPDTTVKALQYVLLVSSSDVLHEQFNVIKLFDVVCSARRLDLVDCVAQHILSVTTTTATAITHATTTTTTTSSTSSMVCALSSRQDTLFTCLLLTLKKSYLPAMKLLLFYDPSLLLCKNKSGASVLMTACYLGKSLEIIRYFCEYNNNVVNMTDKFGCNALSYALVGQNLPAVRYLVEVAQINYDLALIKDDLHRNFAQALDGNLSKNHQSRSGGTIEIILSYLQKHTDRKVKTMKRNSVGFTVGIQAVVVGVVAVILCCCAVCGII